MDSPGLCGGFCCNYIGHTTHERRVPFVHKFRYKLASILIDLDRLDDARTLSRMFSVDAFNVFSFYNCDHGQRDGSSLRGWADSLFEQAGIAEVISSVQLLCSPRVLGYVFNPISIYFAKNCTNKLIGIIYQVHNTFGQSHAYVARLNEENLSLHSAKKIFHVSPFFDISGYYDFKIKKPSSQVKLTIVKHNDRKTDFIATMNMNRTPLTTPRLCSLFLMQPFSTLKTILAIHIEAFKLWLKGARYHRAPPAPKRASFILKSQQSLASEIFS